MTISALTPAARFAGSIPSAATPTRFGHQEDHAHVHGPGCGHSHAHVEDVAATGDSLPPQTVPLTQRLKNFFALPTSPNGNWKGNAWVSGIAGAVLGSLVLPGPGTLLGLMIGWGLSFIFAPTTPPPPVEANDAPLDAPHAEDKPAASDVIA